MRTIHANSLRVLLLATIGASSSAQAAPTPGLAAGVLARSGAYVFTAQNLADVLTLDSGVLSTPMSDAERAAASENILDQFRRNPAAVSRQLANDSRAAKIMRSGNAADRELLIAALRAGWLTPSNDPSRARWLAIMKRHDPVVAEAGGLSLSAHDVSDVREIYSLLLEHSLTTAEGAAIDSVIVERFKQDPATFVRSEPDDRKGIANYVNGTPTERERWRMIVWDNLLKRAQTDSLSARILDVLKKDPTVLIAEPTVVIRQPQLDAQFASNDVVADLAHLPRSNAAERTQAAQSLAAHYGSLSDAQKTRLREAELRWELLQEFVLACNGPREQAVVAVQHTVRSPADIPAAADTLEVAAAKFTALRQQQAMHSLMLAGVAYVGQSQIAALHAAQPNLGGPAGDRAQVQRQQQATQMQLAALNQYHLSAVHSLALGSIPSCGK
jgi:hypothetical protein